MSALAAHEQELRGVWKKIVAKMSVQCDRMGDKIPYIPENGVYPDMGELDISWWTNGFWPGMLWELFNATGDEKYRITASRVEDRLDVALDSFEGLHHDVGFMWLHTAVANWRLTGNPRSRKRAMHAATLLAGRYNPRGKYLRCWNDDHVGWIIVDSLMNIPLLYWASEVSGDPRFRYVATDHADTVLDRIVRPDGSCNHIAILNPENGALVETPGGQGYESGSSWSRGQAWAIYGFALSARSTGAVAYLDAAKRVANYFIANVGSTDWIAAVDFRAPPEPVLIDTSAGLCAACGMLQIADLVPEPDRTLYRSAAFRIVDATVAGYCDWDPRTDAIVGNGTAAYHHTPWRHVPLIYSDFFLIDAITRMLGIGFPIW